MPKDYIATEQMKKIWEEHHNPENKDKKRIEKIRENRKLKKEIDYGI